MRNGENRTCAIDTDGLSKEFGARSVLPRWRQKRWAETFAVDRVDLRIDKGEIFGLVGPNGAGKTTLIKILTTMLLPSSGLARVEGHNVVRAPQEVRKIVGLVTSNERSFYWRMTGRQNMTFFADLYHIPRRDAERWIGELFDLLDLAEAADKRFDSFSTGMRQRIAIARGLLTKPRVLFMDEPTKGVDPINSSQIISLIRDRIAYLWNPTILITSHNLREIEKLCGRIAIMDRGRIIAVGTVDELRHKAGSNDSYRLKVRHVSEEYLQKAVAASGAPDPARITRQSGDNSSDLEIMIRGGSDILSRIIRLIVEGGGDVLDCSDMQESFDDVFHAICANSSGFGVGMEKVIPS